MVRACLCFSLLTGAVSSAEVLHVAPGGDDAAPGTAEAPLASLERALELRREAMTEGKSGEHAILLHDGDYFLSESCLIGAADSGAGAARLTIASHPGERARLLGGVRLAPEAFRPIDDREVASRIIDVNARTRVVEVDLRAAGVTSFEAVQPRGMRHPVAAAPLELFINGEPLTVARWPNEGFVETGDIVDSGSIPRQGETPDRAPVFHFLGERPKRWTQAPDAFAYGYWKWDWADEAIRIAAIDDEAGTIELARPHTYGVFAGRPYYVENLLEEIDRPGEYYIDRAAGKLYLFPPQDLADAEIILSTLAESLLHITNADHVRLERVDLACTRGDAVRVEGGEHVEVVGCRIYNIGARGVIVRGGQHHTIRSCDVFQTGEGGISLTGGERRTLTPARHRAVNNDIHHFNRRTNTYRPGIGLGGVGNAALHNRIHQAPHSAIIFGGNDHRIEFNEIDHVLRRTGDGGAVYTGRDWTTRGHSISHNYFHDLYGERKWENAVYIDDMACGSTIRGNVFQRCHWGMLLGGGRDLLVENNLFVDCTQAVHLDARGLGWAGRLEPTMRERLEAMPYQEEPWRSRYPRLVDILEDDPMTPKGNVLRRNLLVRSGRIDQDLAAAAREHGRIEDNRSLAENPPFLEIRDGRLMISDGAAGIESLPDFEAIPFDRMGLQEDDHRGADGLLVLPSSPD